MKKQKSESEKKSKHTKRQSKKSKQQREEEKQPEVTAAAAAPSTSSASSSLVVAPIGKLLRVTDGEVVEVGKKKKTSGAKIGKESIYNHTDLPAEVVIKTLEANEALRNFITGFYQLLSSKNRGREINRTQPFQRRLDALSRVMTGNEACAAMVFDGEHLLIATNCKLHPEDYIKYRVDLVITRYTPTKISAFLRCSYTMNGEVRAPVNSETFNLFCKDNAKFSPAEGRSTVKITIGYDLHKAKYTREIFTFDVTMGYLPKNESQESEIKKSLKGGRKFILPMMPLCYSPMDPLRRRINCTIEHLAFLVVVTNSPRITSQKEREHCYEVAYRDSRRRLLAQSLSHEATRWYKELGDIRDFSSKEKGGNRKKFDAFIDDLNQDFNDFVAGHSTTSIDIKFVHGWKTSVLEKIRSSRIVIPPFVEKKIDQYIEYIIFYFLDLIKIENYIIDDAKKKGCLTKLLEKEKLGMEKRLPMIVDYLSEGVHAEMRMVWYHLTTHSKEYIGVGKLCCALCNFVMKQFDISDYQGSHGTLFGGWILDRTFRQPEFLERFFGRDLYLQFQALAKQEIEIFGDKKGVKTLASEVVFLIIQSLDKINNDAVLKKLGIAEKAIEGSKGMRYDSDDEEVEDVGAPSASQAAAASSCSIAAEATTLPAATAPLPLAAAAFSPPTELDADRAPAAPMEKEIVEKPQQPSSYATLFQPSKQKQSKETDDDPGFSEAIRLSLGKSQYFM